MTREPSMPAPTSVTIPHRFVGPPHSANGGYTCGVAARAVAGDGPVEVTLRRPPPVDRALRVHRTPADSTDPAAEDTVEVRDGEHVVAAARAAPLTLDLPAPVSPEASRRAADRFDVATYAALHPFPTCFTCGPARSPGDGLRIFPAPVADRAGLVTWPWAPDPSVADDDGLVAVPVVWAALDCPGGSARFVGDDGAQTAIDSVLGRMTTAVHRRPAVGENLVVAGWTVEERGRKHLAGSVLWSDTGEVLAESAAVWIALDPEQRAAFGVAG